MSESQRRPRTDKDSSPPHRDTKLDPELEPEKPAEPEDKDEKINEASEESFPASDPPSWRGGSAN